MSRKLVIWSDVMTQIDCLIVDFDTGRIVVYDWRPSSSGPVYSRDVMSMVCWRQISPLEIVLRGGPVV